VYRLHLSLAAHRQIRRLPVIIQNRVNNSIAPLAENPRPVVIKKLTAREGYRIRVGDYRILFVIDDDAKTVVVYRVKGRGEAYRL
jgi:mRNA interferase RelE/StbE